MRGFIGILASALCLLAAPALADEAQARVVDVGNGLCVVIHTPDGHSMVYDAGTSGVQCLAAVEAMIPEAAIDLMVLSHGDADHIGAVPEIMAARRVLTVVRTGDLRDTATWRQADKAITRAVEDSLTTEVNLSRPDPPPFGTVWSVGAGTATFVAGWGAWPTDNPADQPVGEAEANNIVSIVIRFEYGGHSILLTGDTVGRHIGDDPVACRLAERFMVDKAFVVPIASEVLVGQHHGADNASAACFLREVGPRFVVMSAGHVTSYRHPRAVAVRRVIQVTGLPSRAIFRTDRGDDQGPDEWSYRRIRHCTDRAGDDDVEITIPDTPDQPVRVAYRNATNRCAAP